MGTIDRSDDTIATFSSHGPTAIDVIAKPDVVAPGVGIESLSDPASAFYTMEAPYLLAGTAQTAYLPYLSQSGTSMAAPVVAGAVALMLQANPALTPNQVKAILQYTAQLYPKYDPLTEGAGFLNAQGAVTLAKFLASSSGDYPSGSDWSGRLIWGTRAISGGRITAGASAWSSDVVWGSNTTASGGTISWGEICSTSSCDAGQGWTPWQIACTDLTCGNGTWSNGWSRNVVWGDRCGGVNCQDKWSVNLFATNDSGDTVVWGTGGDGDTVVWGTGGIDTVVWGTSDGGGDTVVWGTSCTDPSCAPVVWPR
jgi:serine protease AprX